MRPAGREAVYDIEVEDNHNFVANGLLVHNCHMLSTAAFNALLKTLEEPPDRVVFVLATTDPQRVLPTIISRCQRFDFRRIPLEAMVSHLQAIAQTEAIDITPEALRLVAQVSQGGLRDAQSLLDQLSLLAGEVTIDRVWDLVGAVPERDLFTLVQAIAADDGVAVLDQARHLMDRGREPLIVLQNLASFYRDLMIAKTSPDRGDLVTITPATWPQLCEFVQAIPLPQLLIGQQHLRSAEVQVKNTTQPRLWLEVTLLGLLPSALVTPVGQTSVIAGTRPVSTPPPRPIAPTITPAPAPAASAPPAIAQPTAPPPTPTPAPASPAAQPATPAPAARSPQPESPAQIVPPEQAESRSVTPPPEPAPPAVPEPTPAPEPAPIPAPTPAPVAPVTPTFDVNQVWQQILAQLQPPATQALLQQHCHLISFDGSKAQVAVSSKPLYELAHRRLPNIEAAFQQVFQTPVRLSLIVASADTTAPAPPIATPAPPPAPSYTPPAPTSPPPSPLPNPHTTYAPLPEPPPDQAAREAATPSYPLPEPPVATPSPANLPPTPEPEPFQVPPPPSGDDLASRASQSFAQFFNGQVVELDDDALVVDHATTAISPPSQLEPTEPAPPHNSPPNDDINTFQSDFEADDDVPF